MSNSYDTAQVCLNGHSVNSSYEDYPQHNKDFCPQCGERTIIECQKCNTLIQGYYRGSMSFSGYKPPNYCHSCGQSYPWTSRALNSAKELINEFDNLSKDDTQILSDNLIELVKAGPSSILAGNRFKKSLNKMDLESQNAMKEILNIVLRDEMKKNLFGE